MGVDKNDDGDDRILLQKTRVGTAIAHIQRIGVGDIGSVFSRISAEKKSEVHSVCGVKIASIVDSFRRCKISGRLPSEITALAEYGLSVIPKPTDNEVEEVTFAAAKHVIGSNYDFYRAFVDRDLADVSDLTTGVDGVRVLIEDNK